MKKVLSCLLVVLILASISTVAFADNFVSSVANAGAPEISSALDAAGNDVSGRIIVTPMDQKDTLPDALKKDLEDAYKLLSGTTDLASVNSELAAAANGKSIAVSDLFDIRAEGEVAFPVTIVLKDKNLNNFLATLHFVNGTPEWVDSEVKDGNLSFSVDGLSPFAIVVTVDSATSPKTGENVPYGFITGAVILAVAAAWFFAKSRKVEA